jgi:hypothetical protein
MPARISSEDALKSMLAAGLKPIVAYINSETPWECECLKCGEIVSPSLHSVRSGQGGCGYCVGKKVNPRKAIEFMRSKGFEPLEDYPGSKSEWKCRHISCGSIVYPIYNRVQQGSTNSGCRDCSSHYVDPKKAEEMMIAAGVIPQELYPGKDKPWKCLCTRCNQLINSTYAGVRDGGRGCKGCANRATAVSRRFSDAEVREIFLKVNLEPIEKYTNTDAPLRCKCNKCGNFPSPTFTAIRAGGGCRYCSEKLTSPEKAFKLAQKAGLEPLEDFVSGQVPWKCRHLKCGTTVFPLFGTILKGNSGCVKCNSKTAADRYRFSEEKAVSIMLNADMQPLEPYVNALTKWTCRCLKCHKIITPKLNNVQNGSRCINCSDSGFKLDKEAYVYLMFHSELTSYKLGIGGSTNKIDRIKTHLQYGWILYNRRDYPTGNLAYDIEQEVLTWLRVELGLGIYLSAEQMPQGGHTETVDASEIDLPTIWAKVEELSKVKK